MLSQPYPDIPYVFPITGFEELLCQFEIQYRLGFPCGSAGKESAQNVESWARSLGWEDPLGKGKATHPLQYSGLENSMDCIVHGVAKSWT